MIDKCRQCGRNALVPAAEKGPGVDGIVDFDKAASMALQLAAEILIAEFSYNGKDPQGVKRYQHEVDYLLALAAKIQGRGLITDGQIANSVIRSLQNNHPIRQMIQQEGQR